MGNNSNNKTGYELHDDAFDDEKTQVELQKAKQANNRGCLIALVIFVAAIIVASVAGLSIVTAVV